MPSFEFADCPTRLDLAVNADTHEQSGSIGCTLRNATSKRQTARLRVEPLGAAKPGWFQLATAPSTAPLEIEEDIAAGGTLAVQVAVKIPPGTPAGAGAFRLRVTSESAPDTDFAEGPAVAFEIAAAAPPPAPAKAPFPWWALAVAAVLLIMVIGAITYLLLPKSLDPKLVIGKKLVDAVRIASEHGLSNVEVVSGDAWGNNPADRVVVDFEPAAPRFEVDDGVTLPPEILNRPYAETVQRLLDYGVLPGWPVLGLVGGGIPGVVITTVPPPGAPIAIGTPVFITVAAAPQFPFFGGQVPCETLQGACGIPLRAYTIDDLNAVARDRLKNRERMVDIILGER